MRVWTWCVLGWGVWVTLHKSLPSLGLDFLIWEMRVTSEPICGQPTPARV